MIPDSTRPRLRSLEVKWLESDGKKQLFLRDPSGVAPHAATVPAWIAQILSLFDGERDLAGIGAAFELRTGQRLPPGQIESLVEQLDEALFLDSPRFAAAQAQAIRAYRDEPYRPAALAERAYPADPVALTAVLEGYDSGNSYPPAASPLRGVVSPHIDYQRGGRIYAQTWRPAAEAVRAAEVVVIFGTDHSGSAGAITLTRQSYATPHGILPTATDIVDRLAEAIGPAEAFAEELHHRNEHSIELAAVWVRAMSGDPPPSIVPILCGSFYEFSRGEANPATFVRFDRLLSALEEATRGKRVLVVAAADLAHVGPAFGDQRSYKPADKKRLEKADERLIESVRIGDAAGFFEQLRSEKDQRKVCGLPPIYLMLRYLGASDGTIVGYDQCPADADGGSVVTIAGILLP
jgi:AmmeMemoRadiSam system protein B